MSVEDKARKPVPTEVRRVYQRVDKLLEERGLTTKWLYERVGMSKEGWSNMLESGSIKLTTLYKVCQAFNVTAEQLMADVQAIPSTVEEPTAPYQARPRYLEERVADLERELHDLKQQLRKR